MMKRPLLVYQNGLTSALMLCISLVCGSGIAADVPAVLPRPDTASPSDGKVKVYILAGQSNMVGFGTLQGSRPVYPSIYLSADPNIKVGRMPVGPSALLRHGVYQRADSDSPKGAKVAIYPGAYKEGTDYSAMKPVKETMKAAGTVTKKLVKWLAEKGYVKDAEVLEMAEERAGEAARDLPAAQNVVDLLEAYLDEHAPKRYSQEIEDHFTITRIEPGRLWLEPFTSGDSTIGPIPVPREVSRMCKEGWDISGVAVKTSRGWRLMEVWSVSP